MADIFYIVTKNVTKIESIIKKEFGCKTAVTEDYNSKRQKISSIPHLEEEFENKAKLSFSTKPVNLFKHEVLSPWEESVLNNVLEEIYCDGKPDVNLMKIHSVLHSLWQKLHTGHWSDISLQLREFYSWGSIFLVLYLLRDFLSSSSTSTCDISVEVIKSKSKNIIAACDRGLLMGKPFKNNPLNEIAFDLNNNIINIISEDKFELPCNLLPSSVKVCDIPREAVHLSHMSLLDSIEIPSIETFLLSYLNKSPINISNITGNWPAVNKWNFGYFHKVAGARTVPVEIGLRYTDADWSQVLMTFDEYLSTCIKSNCDERGCDVKRAYLAQHQLFDQIPELLSDIVIPDYCHVGEKDPVLNAWIGPKGTVTPIHHDPDHNILVQVYGYKVVLLFPEKDSEYLYAYDDEMLSNTSMVNLEEDSQKSNFLEKWPLMKKSKGFYVTLGPGDGLYIPPKWWHYVRSLSNSISVSFWWR